MPACFPEQLLWIGLGSSPTRRSWFAARSSYGRCGPHSRSSSTRPALLQDGSSRFDVHRLAVVGSATERQLLRREPESLHDPVLPSEARPGRVSRRTGRRRHARDLRRWPSGDRLRRRRRHAPDGPLRRFRRGEPPPRSSRSANLAMARNVENEHVLYRMDRGPRRARWVGTGRLHTPNADDRWHGGDQGAG